MLPEFRAHAPVPLPLHLMQAAAASATLSNTSLDALDMMLQGIERWRSADAPERPPPAPTLWSEGATELRDHGHGSGRPILVLPSLINRAYVLDLTRERSFLAKLAGSGFRPLLLDWGVPGPQEKHLSLGDYADTRLRPALAIARVLAGGPVPVMGYCMGGALAAAAAARSTGDVRALVTLGTPWNCAEASPWARVMQDAGRTQVETLRASLRGAAQVFGLVPSDVMQGLFAALDPGLVLRKFQRFARMATDTPEAAHFVAVEDWLNDPVPVAPRVAEEVLVDWHLKNRLASGTWTLLGGRIDPAAIGCPTLSFCATSDLIAPPANAESLPRAIPQARIIRPETGHVGMIVGRKVSRSTLDPIKKFLGEI